MNTVSQIVDQLGGTTKVARLCKIAPPSVSEWKARNQIPKARIQYLMLLHPEIDWAQLHLSDAQLALDTDGEKSTGIACRG